MELAETVGGVRAYAESHDPRRPRLAVAMFAGVVPAMIFLSLATVLALVAFVPAVDMAPALALLVIRISRRWRGVDRRRLGVVRKLAWVMVAEWVILILALVFRAPAGLFEHDGALVFFGIVFPLYFIESLALLLLMAMASASSASAILQGREQLS